MKTLKNQKGITLVALVITIIVLLILAGVSLSLVLGDNGILGRASNSSQVQKAASVRERVELDIADLASEFYQAKYVNNDDSATTVRAYIASKRGSNWDLDSREGTTEENFNGYVVNGSTGRVTMYVKNAAGNEVGTYLGDIDEDGKWTKTIDITTNTYVPSAPPSVPADTSLNG